MTVGIGNLTGGRRDGVAHFLDVPFRDALPHPLYFRSAQMPENASYPRHSHPWGEFVYSYSGMMEVSLADAHYLAPPQYAVWLPPHVEHRGLNRHAAVHCSLYIEPARCAGLPQDKVGDFNTVNLFFKYDVPGESVILRDVELTLNVNNVFDEEPPVFKQIGASTPGYANGFTLGRLVQFGVSKKF